MLRTFLIVTFVLTFGLFVFTFWGVPGREDRSLLDRIASYVGPTGNEEGAREAEARMEIVKAVVAIAAVYVQALGGLALLLNLRYTGETLRISQENQNTAREELRSTQEEQNAARFREAVQMLAGESLMSRMGGIYALERLAQGSPPDHGPVMEVLTAYLREKSACRHEKHPAETVRTEPLENPMLADEFQAILDVLRRRRRDGGRGEPRLVNLSKTNLRHGRLDEAQLEGVDFREGCLEWLGLGGAHLAPLDPKSDALHGNEARLEGAWLCGANLREADLTRAHLDYANLTRADFRGATLTRTHFLKAIVVDADFSGTNLAGVRDLTQEQIDQTFMDEATVPPVLADDTQLARSPRRKPS